MVKKVVTLTDEEIIMSDTAEMRAAATREALSRKQQMEDRDITVDLGKNTKAAKKALDAKIIELCEKKAEQTGAPASSFAIGQERYVRQLIDFAGMSKLERYQWGKAQAFPAVANASEVLDAL